MYKLLEANSQNAFVQSEHLREFLFIYETASKLGDAGGDVGLLELPIPFLNRKRIRVHLRDDQNPAVKSFLHDESRDAQSLHVVGSSPSPSLFSFIFLNYS